MKQLILILLLFCLCTVNAQENWVCYQENGTRIALFIEPSDNQDAYARNVARVFTTATLGDDILALSYQSSSTNEFTLFRCEVWQWQGVLNDSLVFGVSKYSSFAEPSNTFAGSSLKLYKQEEVGSESWGESLFSMCSNGKRNADDVEVSQLYIQLPDTSSSPLFFTPSQLWNRAFLSLNYDQALQELNVDFQSQ